MPKILIVEDDADLQYLYSAMLVAAWIRGGGRRQRLQRDSQPDQRATLT